MPKELWRDGEARSPCGNSAMAYLYHGLGYFDWPTIGDLKDTLVH